jgi:hypothetical protein
MLKLVQIEPGVFELAFDDPDLADDDAAAATLVYGVLCVDAEAPPEREPNRYERRGWMEEPAKGSGLWHVRRQPLGSAARAETLAMIADALAKVSPALTGIKVTEVTPSAGNVSSVFVQVEGFHNGRKFIVKAPA